MLISGELKKTLKRAYEEAKSRKHEFVSLEHLLWALTYDAVASNVLYNCGADIKLLREDLNGFFKEHMPELKGDLIELDPQYTIGVQFVLQLAAAQVQAAEKEQVDGGHVLAALFNEKESHAAYFLKKQHVTQIGRASG